MARVCEKCGKGKLKGNKVATQSQWVTNRSLASKKPNLQKVTTEVNGQKVSAVVCTKCAKGSKKDR